MVNKFTTTIAEKKQIAENTFILSLNCKPLDFKPGQFITFILKDEDGKIKPRSYSLFSKPGNKLTQLLIEFVDRGIAGEQFTKATKTTEFNVMGPLGQFHFQEDCKKNILIATNTGLAPMHSMISEYLDKDYEFTLIFGAKTKERLYLHDEFLVLDKTKNNFFYKPTLSRELKPGIAKGYVQELVEFDKEANYYLCGNKSMVQETLKKLEEHNIPEKNIYHEVF